VISFVKIKAGPENSCDLNEHFTSVHLMWLPYSK